MKELYLRGSNKPVLLDDSDYVKIEHYKWYAHPRGYAQAFIDGKQILMHRFIMQPDCDMQIDHIDRNKLNNQRSNLRIVQRGVNIQNIPPKANNTSGLVGVSRNGKYWQASIYKDRKRIFIGNYKDKISAGIAYNDMALKLYGEHSHINHIPLVTGDQTS